MAVALGAGVAAQTLARRLRLPGIVLLLAVGAFVGPDGLGWVTPSSLGDGLHGVIEFGVAIILFEGGLNLEWSRLKRQETSIRRLISSGAVVTLVGGATLARMALGWEWSLAWLFGSLVVVTGPTVVAPLLRDLRLHPRVKTILEAEGVLIDPIGALLAAFALALVTTPAVATVAAEARAVAASVAVGLGAGLVAGFALAFAFRHRLLVAAGHETIVSLALVVLLFEGCNHVVETSGLVAVTVAGVVVGNIETRVTEDLREFKDRLTVLLVGLLFVLLAADVPLADVRALGAPGVLVVAGLIGVVRPLAVWWSTRGRVVAAGERVFIAAIGPRGIVAASIASLTAATLDERGLAGGDALVALVFLTVAVTVVWSGVVAWPLAWMLDLRIPKRERVALAGATGLAVTLARELRAAGVPVVFLESDPNRARVVEEDGFSVVFGDPLEERTLLRARAELVGTAIGGTFSEHYNGLFVRHAVDAFEVPRGFVALESPLGDKTPSVAKQARADVLFDGAHDLERWDSRWRHHDVSVARFRYTTPAEPGESAPRPRPSPRAVPLTHTRGTTTGPMHVTQALRDGDVAAFALYTPERTEAIADLAPRGWHPVPDDATGDADASTAPATG